jgi:hypothetical protein
MNQLHSRAFKIGKTLGKPIKAGVGRDLVMHLEQS